MRFIVKPKWSKIFICKKNKDGVEKMYPIFLCTKCYTENLIATNYCPNCGKKYKKRYE